MHTMNTNLFRQSSRPPAAALTAAHIQPVRRASLASTTRTWTPHAAPFSGKPIPDMSEDKDAAHNAFMNAFQDSKAPEMQIEGLQEYASAIWERKRRIPSQLYQDPLAHLFREFDEDGDGHLSSDEISRALKSRNVLITPEQVQVFVDIADRDGNKMIEMNEFEDLIFHMASADLNREHHGPLSSPTTRGFFNL